MVLKMYKLLKNLDKTIFIIFYNVRYLTNQFCYECELLYKSWVLPVQLYLVFRIHLCLDILTRYDMISYK